MGLCKCCGKITPGKFVYCYACGIQKKKENMKTYGTRKCSKCHSVVIPKTQVYCAACRKKIYG
ncbi:MAG: hypothetical protein PHU71_04535 [Candidatus Gracilibacteria bacterium]|nr:hypothetical protein [Candidatus Gracilibacteria bacterium]